jgi:hypothetical protein
LNYAQTKVQFIDPPYRLDLFTKDEGIFLPQRIELETLTGTNPQPIEGIKTLHKKTVYKLEFSRR